MSQAKEKDGNMRPPPRVRERERSIGSGTAWANSTFYDLICCRIKPRIEFESVKISRLTQYYSILNISTFNVICC